MLYTGGCRCRRKTLYHRNVTLDKIDLYAVWRAYNLKLSVGSFDVSISVV